MKITKKQLKEMIRELVLDQLLEQAPAWGVQGATSGLGGFAGKMSPAAFQANREKAKKAKAEKDAAKAAAAAEEARKKAAEEADKTSAGIGARKRRLQQQVQPSPAPAPTPSSYEPGSVVSSPDETQLLQLQRQVKHKLHALMNNPTKLKALLQFLSQ